MLIYLLLAAAAMAGLLDEWIESGVILAVVLIDVMVSFLQEGKAERALEGIRKMLSLDPTVVRGGQRRTVDAEALVPGDLVVVRSGDKVPADLRLIAVKDLRVEESPLTGESEDVDKDTAEVEADAVLGDRRNMAISGTTVTYGEARGVVIATGEATEIGRINRMMSDVGDKKTPLLEKIDRFAKLLSVLILAVTGGFFAFGFFVRGFELDEMFLAAIGIVVASIPEGLPAILTIILALGVQRMAARNAIVRRLPSVETLGSVSVICSDKTGTLTRNEMTVRSVATAVVEYEVSGSGYEPEGRTIYDNIKKAILILLPANGAEAAVIIVASLLGLTLPISPVQILWVNMVSAVTLALSLIVEPMERKVMKRPPRRPEAPILDRVFFWRVLFVSLLSGGLTFAAFSLNHETGADAASLAQARTIAVNMLVIAHAFYLFTCRKLYESSISRRIGDNRLAFLLVGVPLVLQAASWCS